MRTGQRGRRVRRVSPGELFTMHDCILNSQGRGSREKGDDSASGTTDGSFGKIQRQRDVKPFSFHPSSLPVSHTWYHEGEEGGKEGGKEREGEREREREGREWKKWELVGGRGTWKPTVPHERLKVKLRSTTAREFGFPLVTEYSQSYPTLPAASAALTLKYDLILPLRTSNRRGKRFRDVPPPSGRPYGCLPRGRRTIGP